MKRWLFNIVAALSLFLTLLAAGAWLYASLSPEPSWRTESLSVVLRRSCAVVVRLDDSRTLKLQQAYIDKHGLTDADARVLISFRNWPIHIPGLQYTERWDSFEPGTPLAATYRSRQFLTISYWLPMAIFSILPAAWAFHLARRRALRGRPGLCIHCGYDLRATKDRCPECGNPVSS